MSVRKLFEVSVEVEMINLDFALQIFGTVLGIHWKSCFIKSKTQAHTIEHIMTDLPKLLTWYCVLSVLGNRTGKSLCNTSKCTNEAKPNYFLYLV